MQSLPTEAGPLSKCSQCGTAMPPPSGSATFVYGVGAVGYQNCAVCGARWRYLWQEPKAPARRANRRFVVIGALLVVAILGIVVALMLHSSPTKFGADADPKTTTSAGSTSPESTTPESTTSFGATTIAPGELAAADDYLRIVGPIAVAKAEFMAWVASTAPSTPQFEVNQRVSVFMRLVRAGTDELGAETFAEPAAQDVEKLLAAYATYIKDVDLIRFGLLHSESFVSRLQADDEAIRDATLVVRRDLGLT